MGFLKQPQQLKTLIKRYTNWSWDWKCNDTWLDFKRNSKLVMSYLKINISFLLTFIFGLVLTTTPPLFRYITSLKTNILYITLKKSFLKLPLQSYLGKGLVSHWVLLPSIHPHRFVAHFWSRLQAWGSTHLRGGLHTHTPPPPQLQRKEHTSVRVKLMLWSSIYDMLAEKHRYINVLNNHTEQQNKGLFTPNTNW